MNEIIFYLSSIGSISLDTIWFPLAIWTLCCGLAFLVLRTQDRLNPLFHYHLRAAALLSLPFSIGVVVLLGQIPKWFMESSFETAFLVILNPIEITASGTTGASETAISWGDPYLHIGIISVLLGFISLLILGQLFKNYLTLRSLHKNLKIIDLQEVRSEDVGNRPVKLAFHDHPLVPFTFGWKHPVIVLPKILRNESEKFQMALQHELIHIKRGDYLLQLALTMIESLFWFHPLIRYGNQEIDTYREISCDQEVLSGSDFSIKSYAELLYELVPLNSGAGRLSVSMAVKTSTLKKRIKIMKYHKLHKASFRQSIVFLMFMIVGITIPIACSDLRGPEVISNKELENIEMKIHEPTITINGVQATNFVDVNATTSGMGAFQVVAAEYGLFKIAPRKFEGAIQAGKIGDNTISFQMNELNVEIKSSNEIITGYSNNPLWVSHIPITANKYMVIPLQNAHSKMPPPPPSAVQMQGNEEDGDYFIVVEEMPKLIGGMKSIQSKIEYPELAKRAGIEGRVTVQFILNEMGEVENAKVVRGIGGGADEEALRVIREAKFEPGIQRGQPVRVRYALSVNFSLQDSEFSETPPPPPTSEN